MLVEKKEILTNTKLNYAILDLCNTLIILYFE